MRVLSLALLAASAIGVASMGSASAMPLAPLVSPLESAVQDVAVRCDRNGRCYQIRHRGHVYAPRAYGRPGHRAYNRGYGYRDNRGYGYRNYRGYGYSSGPQIGIGVGPIGVGVGIGGRSW